MSWNPSGRLLIFASLVIQAAPVRAQAALDSVDRYVRAELARQRIPGISVAVLRGDSVVLVSRWEPLGCDAVGERGMSRLGARIEHICYARAEGPESRLLASVAYTADWRAAALDSYSY